MAKKPETYDLPEGAPDPEAGPNAKPEKAMQVKDQRIKALATCMKEIEKLKDEKEKQWVIRSLVELTNFPIVDQA